MIFLQLENCHLIIARLKLLDHCNIVNAFWKEWRFWRECFLYLLYWAIAEFQSKVSPVRFGMGQCRRFLWFQSSPTETKMIKHQLRLIQSTSIRIPWVFRPLNLLAINSDFDWPACATQIQIWCEPMNPILHHYLMMTTSLLNSHLPTLFAKQVWNDIEEER